MDEGRVALARPRLSVYCLGRLRIEVDDRPASLDLGHRERGVFQYLIAHRRRAVTREELVQVFWPGLGPAAEGTSVNATMQRLRGALRESSAGVPVVVFRDGAYRMSPELEIRVDAEELEDLTACASVRRLAGDLAGAAEMLRSATALYRGPLFDDDPVQEWSAPLRRDLHETHLDALVELAECERRVGDVGAAIAVCHRALGFEPAWEDVHRLLMRCYWQAGLDALALGQLARCEEAMAAAGTAPGAETRSLHRLIGGD